MHRQTKHEGQKFRFNALFLVVRATDYGHPKKPFFIEIPNKISHSKSRTNLSKYFEIND